MNPAFAGGPVVARNYLVEVTPKPASSAGWIMPLLAVVAVVVLASGKDDDEDFQFSDVRLKEDICRVFTNRPGLGVCRYCYRGPAAIHEGVMAQEVEVMHPSDADHAIWL